MKRSDDPETPGSAESSKSTTNRAVIGWMEEIAPYGIFTTDLDLRITSWNRWLVMHSGLPLDQVVGKKLAEIYPDLERRRLLARYARALAGEVSMLSTALHGHLLPFPNPLPGTGMPHMLQTARIAPLPDGGAVVGTITVVEDVTQREFQAGVLSRQQEVDRLLSISLATLLMSEKPREDMGKLFASITPALGLDAYASYLMLSDGQTMQLTASLGIIAKQRVSILSWRLSEEERRKIVGAPAAAGGGHGPLTEEFRKIGLRGVVSFPLAVGERVIGVVFFGSYAQESITPADTNVLARIASYVAIALDRELREREILAASRAKDDFLAALSHELRTPLNPVLLLASDSASHPEYPAEARNAFRVIEKNILLEARLIDDLLDLTRIGHGKVKLDLQTVDLHLVLQDALANVRRELEEKKLALQLDFDPGAKSIPGDPARLQQVFWNVIKNAVKFTPPGGTIRIATHYHAKADEMIIAISDTGLGMTPDEVGRVFTAFTQGDHAGRGRGKRFGGLGLGLAISRQLLDLHGGVIEAASEGSDRGSTFTIRLPCARPNPDASADPVAANVPAAAERQPGRGRKILLVEDHEPTLASLGVLLARRGYEVAAVSSGAEALRTAKSAAFDLVLSDIGLPDLDGYELMSQLRTAHGLKGIALTGYGMEDDLERAREAGYVAHLTKPISVSVLDLTLEKVFAPSESTGRRPAPPSA